MKLPNLYEWFQETREWRKLKPNSRKMYKQMMRHTLDKFPIMDKVHRITTKVVDEWYDELVDEGKTHKAVSIMKVNRRIWNVAKRTKLVTDNPFEKMNLDGLEARTTIWTRNQVDAVVHSLNKKGYDDTAFFIRLCYHLAQRPGDILKLTKAHMNIEDQTITVQQDKTGTIVTIPVPDDLWVDMLLAGYFLIEQSSLRIHNKHFSEVRKELDLEHLQIRDLRRTALTEIMEAGASDAEGQAISGHKNRDMLSIYAPPTVKMAKSAMFKRYSIFNDL